MFGASVGSILSPRRLLRPSLGCALLLSGLPQVAHAWVPIVELKFESGASSSPNNTGSAGGAATLSATTPTYSTNIPINGGTYALDMGNTNGNFYADMATANVFNGLKSLKSFTITGWVNSRSSVTSAGGSRIVSWYKGVTGFGGVDLAFRSDGSLGLGVNTWNDQGGVTSSETKIPVDANMSPNNWRFFAVSYDGTASTDNVKFYFGSNTVLATLDRTADLNKGVTAANTDTLAIGNVGRKLRSTSFCASFRGLIDQVRIYGSTSNTSGVLNLDQIQSLQQATPLVNVSGVLYEQWNNVSGTSLSDLRNDSRFPYNPSNTKLQTTFEGFTNIADNFGARLSGWVKAPATGSYTFWVVADDKAELSLSTDANPDNKRVISYVNTYNSAQDQWEQYGGQKSEPVTLEANRYYYIEALMKEGTGGDFLRVGWQLPSGTQERPIPQARMVTTPPDAVPFYPSQYPVYEPGTYVKKASMGWQKEEGNDRFYIKTDETEVLTAKDGMVRIPTWLQFGGKFPDDPGQGDLRFRWDREVQENTGKLILETQGVHWALKVDAGSQTANPPVEPSTEFNQVLNVSGPNFHEGDAGSGFTWNGSAKMDYFNGTYFERRRESDANSGQTNGETSLLNGGGLLVTSADTLNSLVRKDTTDITSSGIHLAGDANYNPDKSTLELNSTGLTYEMKYENGAISRTTIDQEGLTTPRVTTKVWKVAVPDYVFEKGYPLRSLEETERFVKEKKHLPGIPSAKEMSAKGLDLTEMNMQLLKKVEELTLHMIAMDKELKAMKADRRQGARGEQSVGAQRPGKGK